jgi:hypothetical protein
MELSVSLTPEKTVVGRVCSKFRSKLRAARECRFTKGFASKSRSRFCAKSKNARDERFEIASGIVLILVPIHEKVVDEGVEIILSTFDSTFQIEIPQGVF